MSKTRIKYTCSNCGYETLRWLGKCPECENWNSFTEEIIEKDKRKTAIFSGEVELNKINEVDTKEELGASSGIDVPTVSVAIVVEGEAKDLLKEISIALKK